MSAHARRIQALQGRLEALGCDGLLITNLTNVRYLTGFSGTNGQVLVTPTGARFYTDPRYEARAGDLVDGADVVVYPARLTDVLTTDLAASSVRVLGIEAKTMTIAERDDLAERLDGAELVATSNAVEDLRRTKDEAELAAIRAAVVLGDAAFATISARISAGTTERAIALDLEMEMRNAGAEAVAFEPIVGSGPLSAHIHHTPSDRALEKGDLVIMDLGCKVDGYCSDLTRTVVLGPATDEQKDLYSLVLGAQVAGIAAAGPGISGRDVDAAARAVIEGAGHGERFGHGLGHGVGLDIHEAPRLHRISEDTLRTGDVVTVEPGVYVPGSGGIRIEDCVVITEDGAEVLGSAPKNELIEL